jgi:hypothetical protein
MNKYNEYKKMTTPHLLYLAFYDSFMKAVQQILVAILFVVYWEEYVLELKIIFGITFLVFTVVQLYSRKFSNLNFLTRLAYIYWNMYKRLCKENKASESEQYDGEDLEAEPTSSHPMLDFKAQKMSISPTLNAGFDRNYGYAPVTNYAGPL